MVLFLILFMLSPLVSRFLNIDNNWYWVIFASSFLLAFMVAANWGILQGLQRFSSSMITLAVVVGLYFLPKPKR